MRKNHVVDGIVAALIFPIVGFLFWTLLNFILESANIQTIANEVFQFRQRTVVLLSIAFNLIPVQHTRNKRWYESMRGAAIITMALMMGWAFYYGVLDF